MGGSIARLGRPAVRCLNRALPTGRGGVTVLAYHLVGAETAAPVDLPIDVFRAQLDELASGGRVVSLSRAIELLDRGADRARHRVVLTFDDAFHNFFAIAWPMLRARDLPAVLYVPVGFVDGSSPAPLTGAEHLPPMTWNQIRELAATELITIGSHSITHPDLRRLSQADCRGELEGSRRRLEAKIGADVSSFCYPRALWSPAVRDRVAAVYDSAVAAGGRRNRATGFDRHSIYRLPLRRDMPAALATILEKPVWLEEWAADGWRRLARR